MECQTGLNFILREPCWCAVICISGYQWDLKFQNDRCFALLFKWLKSSARCLFHDLNLVWQRTKEKSLTDVKCSIKHKWPHIKHNLEAQKRMNQVKSELYGFLCDILICTFSLVILRTCWLHSSHCLR